MPKSRRHKTINASPDQHLLREICYEGERLANLLQRLQGELEVAKLSKGSLSEKIWMKQQFSIGVNEVTRVLERMAPCRERPSSAGTPPSLFHIAHKARSIQLQAVFLASDCNPRWLVKHLPSLALSRGVPLIYVKDDRLGSLRLGELVKLKTAMAIGVKDEGSCINRVVEEVLENDSL